MTSLIKQVQRQLQDPESRRSLVASAARREERLLLLGRLDLDCQLLQSEGRSVQAQDVYRQIVRLEQELGL